MIQEAIPYDRSRFNGLLSVEAADAEMRVHDKLNTAFSVLAPVFQKHDMCEVWGLSLLHKHWSLGEHELPITTLNRTEIPREYELRPRGHFSQPFHAAILAIGHGQDASLEPLEYSADQAAAFAVDKLRAKPEFVKEFCELLVKNDLSSTFGLGLPRPVASGYELVEFTHEDRTSVSKELPSPEVAGMKVIETGWMFGKGVAGKCEKSCFAKCNVPGHTPTHSPAHKPGD